MGSYLKINGTTLESKSCSRILSNALEELYSKVVSDPESPEEAKKLFKSSKPYGQESRYGGWKIRRKGVAVLVLYLNNLATKPESLLEDSDYQDYINKASEDEEKERLKEECLEEIKGDLNLCSRCMSIALADMILNKRKHIHAEWI